MYPHPPPLFIVLGHTSSIAMAPKGGKSKAGEASATPSQAGPKAFQTRSAKAGLQVRLAAHRRLKQSTADLYDTFATTTVPSGPYTPVPEAANAEQRADRGKSRGVHFCDPGVPHGGGPRARRCVARVSPFPPFCAMTLYPGRVVQATHRRTCA